LVKVKRFAIRSVDQRIPHRSDMNNKFALALLRCNMIGGGPDWPGYEYVAETMRNLMPALERMSGLDPNEVGVDTLADRFREEVVAERGVQMLPMMAGAFARRH
jgi:hypothetical protein